MASDVWSLAVTLFHLVSGTLPFAEQTAAALAVAIASDLDKPSPDIRDCSPENVRSGISSVFAAVILKGMEKRLEKRYHSIDEFASDLHGCLVQKGEGLYSAFISYRVFSQKYHAMLLYDVLNNTTTAAGHRVIVYLDVKRLVKGEDWEEGFSNGLLNSLVALPLLSLGVIDPMTRLKGSDDDPEDNVTKEFLIMQAILNSDDDSLKMLEAIFPILIGKPCAPDNIHYPCTGNFFTDGSNHGMRHLVNTASPNIAKSVAKFLKKQRIAVDAEILSAPISTVVKDLFALQGSQLWNHGNLPEEDITIDSELWGKVANDQSDPPLDIEQLRKLKAEFRAVVPSIHEVIDRAQASATARRKKMDKIEARRKQLMQKVVTRLGFEAVRLTYNDWRFAVGKYKTLRLKVAARFSLDTLTDALETWKESVGEDERHLQLKLRSLQNNAPTTSTSTSASGWKCLPCCNVLVFSLPENQSLHAVIQAIVFG